jgi:hypothetical protein
VFKKKRARFSPTNFSPPEIGNRQSAIYLALRRFSSVKKVAGSITTAATLAQRAFYAGKGIRVCDATSGPQKSFANFA